MSFVRLMIAVALLVGCRDSRKQKDTVAPSARWQTIEALARPDVEPKAHEELARAIKEQSVEALVKWHGADGGLVPPPVDMLENGKQTMAMLEVGKLAAAQPATAGAAAHLGYRMITQGRTILEVMIGITLLQEAKKQGPLARVPAPTELARLAAAEAMFSRTMSERMKLPSGDVVAPLPAGTNWADLERFWFAALDGAKRGEPATTTIDRLKAAHAKVEGTPLQQIASPIVDTFERAADDLKALQ